MDKACPMGRPNDHKFRFHGFRVALASGSALIALPLHAQSLPDGIDRATQRLQEQQQQEARDRAERFEQKQQRPPTGSQLQQQDTSSAGHGGCVAIRDVRLLGMSRYTPEDFVDALGKLRGDCVAIPAIDTALHTITDRYVHDGYVTSRAFVSPQNLRNGLLTITVIEGRVSKVTAVALRHSEQPAPPPLIGLEPVVSVLPRYSTGELAAGFPVRPGEVLNLRALEQGVDQLARLTGSDPDIDITPGDTPGTSTVQVKREHMGSWLRPAVSFSNDGQASTGRLQSTATLDADSPLGLADLWSLYAQHDIVSDRLRGNEAYGGFVSLPRGWWTLSLSGGASDYHSVLSGNGLSFATRGTSWNASAALDRMIHRNARTKISLSASLAIIDTQNFIQGIKRRTGSYRITTANVALHWQQRLGSSLLAGNLGYSRGLGLLGAHTVDTGPGGATGQFDMVSSDLTLQSPFAVGPARFTNVVLLRGQWGFENLFPASRFSLGGSSTVRGFRDDGISGRAGLSLREQLGFGIMDLARRSSDMATRVSAYLAYDVGAIRPNAYDPYERGVLQSGTIGVRAQARHVQADLALAIPITTPSWVHHKSTELLASIRFQL